jgi:hypothetical protein
MAIKGIEANKVNSAGLLEISENTTVKHLFEIIGKKLAKDVSKDNRLKENWVTINKDLREAAPDTWIKWNLLTKLAENLRLRIHSEKGFLVDQTLRDLVCYVVDLGDVPKCGSFNPYGNEQMESDQDTPEKKFFKDYKVDEKDASLILKYFEDKALDLEMILLNDDTVFKVILTEMSISAATTSKFLKLFQLHNKMEVEKKLSNEKERKRSFDEMTGSALTIELFNLHGKDKKKKIKKSDSIVIGYSSEGIWSENFNTLRERTVEEIINTLTVMKQILIHSPTFTGKSSLCHLIAQELLERGNRVFTFNMLEYKFGEETLEEFWIRKYSVSYSRYFELKATTDVYILIDEYQMTYASSTENVRTLLTSLGRPTDKLEQVVASHQHFHSTIKQMRGRNETDLNIKLLCFSSYCSNKIGSLLSSPSEEFGVKLSKFGKFSPWEIDELFEDFISRTRISFIRTSKSFPASIKELIVKLTDGHIGYLSAILHEINSVPLICTDEKSLARYIHSQALYRVLCGKRPPVDISTLTKEKQEAMKVLWRKGTDSLDSSQFYDEFIRRGFIAIDDNNVVKLFCPLAKQLMLMDLCLPIRPLKDNYNTLPEFFHAFLSSLDSAIFKSSLSINSEGRILESLWQEEFYRLSCSLLSTTTLINVEVQYVKGSNLGGKVDFYINGDREWALEFLICGNTNNTNKSSKQEYHTAGAEHLSRFNETGKYHPLHPKDYLVVDFRPQSVPTLDDHISQGQTTVYNNYWLVRYDDKGWKNMLVTKIDKDKICQKKDEIISFVHPDLF